MRDDNFSTAAPQTSVSSIPFASRHAEPCPPRVRVGGNRRLGELMVLLWETAFTVERCFDDLAGSGSGIEIYQLVLERVASLRVGYRELSALEQKALEHNVAALEEDLDELTTLVSRKVATSRQASTARPRARAATSSFAPAQ